MAFEVIVIVILIVLVVNQFDLWNRFTEWFNKQAESDYATSNRNYKGYIFIVLVGAVFAFITAYFQSTREIDMASTTLALQQLSNSGEVIAESAINAQTQAFRNAFDFTALYWNKFFENAALYIMLPILIGIGTVFMHDEMKKTKEDLANVTIGNTEKQEKEIEDVVEVVEVEPEQVSALVEVNDIEEDSTDDSDDISDHTDSH